MKKMVYVLIGIVIGVLLTFVLTSKTKEAPPVVVKPKGVISKVQAKVLDDNWTRYRQAAVDSAAQKQGRNRDTRSVYWSLDDFENYLSYAQQQADSLGYDMTGIRVYLGVYGKNAGLSKKNLTTMFVVPTGRKAQSKAGNLSLSLTDHDIPVNPLNDGTGGEADYNP